MDHEGRPTSPGEPPDDRTLAGPDRAAIDPDATVVGAPDARFADHGKLEASEQVGNYRLVRRLGEGGMGEVWEAEQLEPVRRQVALKLIRAGMDSDQFIARFEVERQALALMDHPGIARIFDAGTTPMGRPFFAMEFVPGAPINEYCDTHDLDTRDRLRLFEQVCDGVQHAHQKAIIHRDLKPTNILVTQVDGKPVPKIIDFGVAKATSEKLTDRTMFTQAGALIGTLEYMSPEQVEVSGLDIDTRTDVYALGVVLYELLVGKLPFDTRELPRTGLDEICRIIREDDPLRPSTRISSRGEEEGTSIRRVDRRSLARQLRGELDWITMKALEKDRSRRYQSARALAADVERYLNDEPLEAGPPSRTYRARKFVRRHRTIVIAAGFVGLALVLGTIGSTWGFLRATRAESDARHEAAKATAVNEILHTMLRSVSPETAKGQEVTVREVLDEASKQVGEASTPDEAEVEAAVRNTIGSTYQSLGLYEQAEPHLRSALATRRQLFGEEHPEVAESLRALGQLLWNQSDYAGAEPLFEEALSLNRRLHGDEHETVAVCLADLAVLLQSQGEYDAADPILREALAVRASVHGEDDPEQANLLNSLAWGLYFRGEVAEAEAMFRESVEMSRLALGADHPQVPAYMVNLGATLQAQGKFDEAESIYLDALEITRRVLGADHSLTLQTLQAVGELHLNLGRPDDAEPLLTEALATAERTLGPDHTLTIVLLADVGWVHRARGDLAAAEPRYREVLARRRRALGARHPHTLRAQWQVSRLLVDQAKHSEGELLARDALVGAREVFPARNDNLLATLLYLGLALVGQERFGDAEPYLRECLEAREASLPAGSWQTEQARSALGASLAGQGRFAEAEPLLVRSFEGLDDHAAAPAIRTQHALTRLIALQEAWYADDPTEYRANELSRWRAVDPGVR